MIASRAYFQHELVLEATHCIAVCLHLLVVAAGFLHLLIDDELGVSPDVEALDAELDGDTEATKEGCNTPVLIVLANHGFNR